MYSKIYGDLNKALDNLQVLLSSISKDKINQVPFEGSWTAGQLMDHTLKSLEGVNKVIHHKTGPAERAPDQFISELEKLFLNFNIKMKAPEFAEPGLGPFEQLELITRLKKIQESMKQQKTEEELSQLCLASEFPGFGLMTCLEWLHFALYHTIRHTRQLVGISDKLKT